MISESTNCLSCSELLGVAVAAVGPAGAPAGLASGRGGVGDTEVEAADGGFAVPEEIASAYLRPIWALKASSKRVTKFLVPISRQPD